MVSTGPDGFPACYRGSVRLRSLFRLFNTIRTKPTDKLRRHIVSQALQLLPHPQGDFPLWLPRSRPGAIFEFLVSPALVECYLSTHPLNHLQPPCYESFVMHEVVIDKHDTVMPTSLVLVSRMLRSE